MPGVPCGRAGLAAGTSCHRRVRGPACARHVGGSDLRTPASAAPGAPARPSPRLPASREGALLGPPQVRPAAPVPDAIFPSGWLPAAVPGRRPENLGVWTWRRAGGLGAGAERPPVAQTRRLRPAHGVPAGTLAGWHLERSPETSPARDTLTTARNVYGRAPTFSRSASRAAPGAHLPGSAWAEGRGQRGWDRGRAGTHLAAAVATAAASGACRRIVHGGSPRTAL